MRAALFGQIDPNSQHMGALTETAIYSQWQHGNIDSLYYARWDNGEIDIVDNRVAAKSFGDVAQFNEIFLSHSALHYAWFLAFEREIRASPISQSKMKIIASITTIRIEP